MLPQPPSEIHPYHTLLRFYQLSCLTPYSVSSNVHVCLRNFPRLRGLHQIITCCLSLLMETWWFRGLATGSSTCLTRHYTLLTAEVIRWFTKFNLFLSLKNVKYSRQKIVDMLIYYSELQQNDLLFFSSMAPFLYELGCLCFYHIRQPILVICWRTWHLLLSDLLMYAGCLSLNTMWDRPLIGAYGNSWLRSLT